MFASLYLAPRSIQADMYFEHSTDKVREAFDNLEYTFGGQIEVEDMVAEADYSVAEMVADYVFDLTNNPYRQEEREMKYGRGRSVSVGDVIRVGDTMLVCMSCGWEQM